MFLPTPGIFLKSFSISLIPPHREEPPVRRAFLSSFEACSQQPAAVPPGFFLLLSLYHEAETAAPRRGEIKNYEDMLLTKPPVIV